MLFEPVYSSQYKCTGNFHTFTNTCPTVDDPFAPSKTPCDQLLYQLDKFIMQAKFHLHSQILSSAYRFILASKVNHMQ